MFSSSTGLFSFQFSSREGLNAMLENSPWFLRNSPLILKKWHPDLNLLKEDVGTPLMLDSYTSDICMKSWDRSSYARAMIELRADVELRDNIVAAMPKITGEGYYTCNIPLWVIGGGKIVRVGFNVGKGPTWLFDLDYLTDSMNYQPVRSENQANKHACLQEAKHNAGTEDIIDAGDSEKEDESVQDCFVLPIWSSYSSTITPDLKTDEKREGPREEEQVFLDELERLKRQEKDANEAAEALRKKAIGTKWVYRNKKDERGVVIRNKAR
ncbi:hypothetical protein Tco_1010771, partial [Tanacetum coccineum]